MQADVQDRPNASIPGSRNPDAFDVIVVGASLAGCAVARLYALAGLRVALLERSRDPEAHKQFCTHFIQASATPCLRRLGLERLIEEAGGVRNGLDLWCRYGWIHDAPPLVAEGVPAHGFNIRRQKLDPMLRRLAASTPGVTFMAGSSVQGLVTESGAVRGVHLAGESGARLRARLVVAADGRNSAVARLAGVTARTSENIRAGGFRAYRNVPLRRGQLSQMWVNGPDMGYVFPNDEGVCVVAFMTGKDRLPEFQLDPDAALERHLAALPDAPDLSRAEPCGRTVLVKDFPNLWRPPVAHGIAFVGDAQMSLDFLWGTGCGFAFQEAEWLVDATRQALRDGGRLAPALRGYARQVGARLAGHRFLIADFSRRRDLNPIERLMYSAAARDRDMARHFFTFGARFIGPAKFLAPAALLRAAWIRLARRTPRLAPASAIRP